MKNKIICIDSNNAKELLHKFENDNYLVIVLEGSRIKSENDFYSAIENPLSFPNKCNGLFARFYDWITDLTWIDKNKGICIAVKSFSEFLNDDKEFKKYLINSFEEYILPFWENEVVNIIKDGAPRKFCVLLID